MDKFVFLRRDTELLIDTLVHSGGGADPYGKLSHIIEAICYDSNPPPYLRHNLLVWLDSMGILDVDFQDYKYSLYKPLWVPTAIEDRYILMGALTIVEIERLKELGFPTIGNTVQFGELRLELPNTFYCDSLENLKSTGFDVSFMPLFADVDSQESHEDILEKLKESGKVGYLSFEEIELSSTNLFYRFSFIENSIKGDQVHITQDDLVTKFNWRSHVFEKCNIIKELQQGDGIKLIRVLKEQPGGWSKKYTLLLEKASPESKWEYYYFDNSVIDERWARFIYFGKEKYYDLKYDLKRSGDKDKQSLKTKIEEYISLYSKKETIDHHHYATKEEARLLIPQNLKKKLFQYDVRNGILGLPKHLPLPNKFMRYLFSCSGQVPQVFKYQFTPNPNYPIKLLFSGKLVRRENIPYPDETFYKEEDLFLFTAVPSELINKIICDKLGLNYYKKTFFKSLT